MMTAPLFKQVFKSLVLSALAVLGFSLGPAQAAGKSAEPVKLCAVTQLYDSVEMIRRISPISFKPYYGTENEIYALLSNREGQCDLILSSSERLPITLIRAELADPVTMSAFTRAPLILWSADPQYFRDGVEKIIRKEIKSIAIPDARLTPAGFAASQITKDKAFPTDYLRNSIYRAPHEYQIYGMVSAGYVECGFITKPLIASLTREAQGSYWEVPRGYHPDILYYSVLAKQNPRKTQAQRLAQLFSQDEKFQEILNASGFAPLNIDNEPYRQLLPGFKARR